MSPLPGSGLTSRPRSPDRQHSDQHRRLAESGPIISGFDEGEHNRSGWKARLAKLNANIAKVRVAGEKQAYRSMMTLSPTVNRGAQQIGGSCIEIAHPNSDRLILAAGRPLDAPDGATRLLPASLDKMRAATVLISHPHQDHWGLVEEIHVNPAHKTAPGSASKLPPACEAPTAALAPAELVGVAQPGRVRLGRRWSVRRGF